MMGLTMMMMLMMNDDAITAKHSLNILNSWNGFGCSPHTFQFGAHKAQLDFILTRARDANGTARLAHPVHAFPVGASRRGGAFHVPVIATIPVKKPPWVSKVVQPRRQCDREKLIAALQQPNEEDIDKLNKLRSYTATRLQAMPNYYDIDKIAEVVADACNIFYPTTAGKHSTLQVWQDPQLQTTAKQMWKTWREIKTTRATTIRSMFYIWRKWAKYNHIRKQQRRQSKQIRKARFLDHIEVARTAAKNQDTRGLYFVVKKLAPKTRRVRMALRGERDEMLTPQQEAWELFQHFQERFSAKWSSDEELLGMTWEVPQPPELSEEMLAFALGKVPLHKAVPPGHPPSASWRVVASEVAQHVCRGLQKAWRQGLAFIPKTWSAAYLALILKPQKNGKLPIHYRPVGLPCQLGKTTLAELMRPVRSHVYTHIKRFPQFAYCPGRSHKGALRRVFMHCSQIRSMCANCHRSLHDRYKGLEPKPLMGGLQVSIDLTQAFDCMPRTALLQGLRLVEMPEELISILMQWHSQAMYTIQHEEHIHSFKATRGVRQGRVVAPLPWLIFLHAVCVDMSQAISHDELCQLLTLFADDFHCKWIFQSLPELERSLQVLSLLFQTLEKHGMQANPQKSKAILAIRGTQQQKIKERVTARTAAGRMLRLRTKARELQSTDTFTYLGAQVGYKNFEDRTRSYRLSCGNANYWRLAVILRGQNILASKTRMQLWRACIWTSTAHALDCSGITPAGIKILNSTIMRQVRAILRCPAHITRIHGTDLMRHGLDLPSTMLEKALKLELEQSNHYNVEDNFNMQCKPWHEHLIESFSSDRIVPIMQCVDEQQGVPCEECGLYLLTGVLCSYICPKCTSKQRQPLLPRSI